MTNERSCIKEVVDAHIKRIGELDPDSNIDDSASISEDIGIDSLAQIDLVVNIEKHFSVMLAEASLVNVRTVGDLVDIVATSVNA